MIESLKRRIQQQAFLENLGIKLMKSPLVVRQRVESLVHEPNLIETKIQSNKFSEVSIGKLSKKESGIMSQQLRPNQITDCSDKGLRNLIENHKEGIVPEIYLGTPNEEIYKDFFFAYCVQFRDVLASKDVFMFNTLFLDSLGNKNLYSVSGFSYHVLSSIFSIVVSQDTEKFKDVPEFSASNLSSLVDTKNLAQVDLGLIELKATDKDSFKKAYEILIARARMSDLNDSNLSIKMTDDDPTLFFYEFNKQGYEITNNTGQNYFDAFIQNKDNKTASALEFKVSGEQKLFFKSNLGSKVNSTTYVGPMGVEKLQLLKSKQCQLAKTNIKHQLAKRNISEEEKQRLLKIKHLVIGYENASSPEAENHFFQKLDAMDYPLRSFVTFYSFK